MPAFRPNSSAAKQICLVVPGHLTATPRLIKEAQALVDAGYRVHTVSLDNFAPNRSLDDTLLASARWTATRIATTHGAAGIARKILHRGALRLPTQWLTRISRLAARAKSADVGQLARAAEKVRADYYLGHCLAALPAVAMAAQARSVRFGFDLEDFHEAETVQVEQNPKQLALTQGLLKRYLPQAAHLTAASPLIAEAYERGYGVQASVVLNVFPLDEAPSAPIDPGPVTANRPAVLYWVSQTIGPGRGLEEVVAALAHVRTTVELHLRGHITPGYESALGQLAEQLRCRHPIRFLPFSLPNEVIRLAASADLGLSTEQKTPLNRALCLTNKVFIYPLAGVPQLLSQTPAQAAIAPKLGPAGLLFRLADSGATADTIDTFFGSPERVRTARRHAWHLGQSRYNWEYEQEIFLSAVRAAIGGPVR